MCAEAKNTLHWTVTLDGYVTGLNRSVYNYRTRNLRTDKKPNIPENLKLIRPVVSKIFNVKTGYIYAFIFLFQYI